MICAIGVSQTRRLRDRILLGAQIAAEDRRSRRGDGLETHFRSERDTPALDALNIDRCCPTLVLGQRYRSFPEQCQSTSCSHIHDPASGRLTDAV
jgi:hypothetical protein